MIEGPMEYGTGDWGKQSSTTYVWEGPMTQLVAYRDEIIGSYTSTQITPTKGDHGRLRATLTETMEDGAASGKPTGDLTIEVEWLELRLPVESNPFFDDLSAGNKAAIRNGAMAGTSYGSIPLAGDLSVGNPAALYNLLAAGTTEYSTGVPVVRQTTKNASSITKGSAWFRDTPPVTISGGWEWLKTADRRTRIGHDIVQIEEWTGSQKWDDDLYPAAIS